MKEVSYFSAKNKLLVRNDNYGCVLNTNHGGFHMPVNYYFSNWVDQRWPWLLTLAEVAQEMEIIFISRWYG